MLKLWLLKRLGSVGWEGVIPMDPLARVALVRSFGWNYRPGEWSRGEERAASVDAILERMGVGP